MKFKTGKTETHMTAKARREQLLQIGVKLALKHGYTSIIRKHVADMAEIYESTVTHYFCPFETFKTAVLARAIKDEVLEIIAQGMLNRDPLVRDLSDELKEKVIRHMANI